MRGPVVGDSNGDRIGPGRLIGGGRPGEHAAGRVDGGTGRRAGIETESQRVGRDVGVLGGGFDGKLGSSGGSLVVDGRLYRRGVHFVDRDDHGLGDAQRRQPVVDDSNRHGVSPGSLCFGRHPGEHATHRVNGCAGRRTGIEAEGQGLCGDIGIGCLGSDSQRRQFIDSLIWTDDKRWGAVHLVNRDHQGPGVAQGR